MFGRVAPLRLEIGFGNGEHLVAEAERFDQIDFIGCEPFENGVSACLAAVLAAGIENVRVLPDDARPLLARLPEASLDRAVALFPDPWPKVRHHKRRLIGPETLPLLARALADGAELRLATDVADLAEWMETHVAAWPEFEPLGVVRLRPHDWPPTRYEAKALSKGLVPWYGRWRRVGR